MSAIFGICSLNDEPVKREVLDSMAASLSHHGTDRRAVWVEGVSGLGRCATHITPESILESQPYQFRGLIIVADARIDNREELLRALIPEPVDRAKVTDSELILRAYREWQESCPERLIGDFVFAIWDASNRRLFCARDHLGVKPLYYSLQPGKQFVFASEIKSILRGPDVREQLDEAKLADYMLDNFEDTSRTFYLGINRLPPASWLDIQGGRVRRQTYWALDPERQIRRKRDSDYSDEFRSLFFESIKCRLRSAYPVGTMLSGGLDSSSITCAGYEINRAANGARLHAFSIIFDEVEQSDERKHIQSVLEGKNIAAHFINGDCLTPFDDLDAVLRLQDEPICAPNMALTRSVWRSAREQGVRVLLDGLLGDNVVSHGIEHLNELAGRWKLIQLGRELQQLIHRSNREVSLAGALMSYWVREGIKPRLPKALLDIWRKCHGYPVDPTENKVSSFQAEFVERTGIKQRLASAYTAKHALKNARLAHSESLTCGLVQSALETYSHGCAEFGIETRFPFADKRLVEYCLAIPGCQKVAKGYTRMILRRAMAGCLPEQIRWRVDKGDLGWSFARGFSARREFVELSIKESEDFLRQFLDFGRIDKMLHRMWNSSLSDENLSELFSLVVLSVWYSKILAK